MLKSAISKLQAIQYKQLTSSGYLTARYLSSSSGQDKSVASKIEEKMRSYKGEQQLGNAPREDERPAPKKEDAPHKKVPEPEQQQPVQKKNRGEGKGVTDVDEEHQKGMYDEPVTGKQGEKGLWTPPEKTPGDIGPQQVPGIGSKGILHTESKNPEQKKKRDMSMDREYVARGFGLHSYSYKDIEQERQRAQQQEAQAAAAFEKQNKNDYSAESLQTPELIREAAEYDKVQSQDVKLAQQKEASLHHDSQQMKSKPLVDIPKRS